MTRLAVGVIGMNVVIAYPSHQAAMAAIEGPLCLDPRHATLDRDRSAANERIAVLEGALRDFLENYELGDKVDARIRATLGATETEPGEGTWEAYKDAFPAGKNVRE